MLVELHVVVVHEHVGLVHEIEIAEPGQISGLQHDERRHEACLRLRCGRRDIARPPPTALDEIEQQHAAAGDRAEGGREPVKTLPLDVDRPAFVVEEPPGALSRRCSAPPARWRRTSSRHLPDGFTGAASYMRRASQELLDAVPAGDRDLAAAEGAIFECLRRVIAAWPDIAAGKLEGEHVFSGDPGLWKRAMTEWPMGGFARMTADS